MPGLPVKATGTQERGSPALRNKREKGESSAEQVAVFLKSGPGDRTIRELHTDAEAIVVGQLLTINDLPEGRGGMQGSNAYHIAGVPGLFREIAGAVGVDVLCVGVTSFVGLHIVM